MRPRRAFRQRLLDMEDDVDVWRNVATPGSEIDGKTSNIDIPTFEATTLPEGWEPIGGEGYGAIIARHCVK